MKRRRVEGSADGLALMTSSVTSSQSADGLREQSQESAGPRPEGRLLHQPALEGLTRSARTDSPRKVGRNKFRRGAAARRCKAAAGGGDIRERRGRRALGLGCNHQTLNGKMTVLPLNSANHDLTPVDFSEVALPEFSSYAQHIELSITDSACKNQLVVVSVQYGPFNPYIPIRSTTIGKLRVVIDPIATHTSWRSNSDIASVTSIGYPRMSASGEFSTTMHRLLHASGPHPIPPPNDPKPEKILEFKNSRRISARNCCTLCASPCAACAHGRRPPARPVRAGGAAAVRDVHALPCATCAHDVRPVCAATALHRAQHVRTVTGQCAHHMRTAVRNMHAPPCASCAHGYRNCRRDV
ncbi:hypothetical protein F511_25500 [Dorcoceras hygrometricum]|uniref:Uncharacterized protein n=1 Tax=Dorcoceras hygrometricum TaxID=472368 RepID=A0A2Z7C4N7_9LAMI|nr:hypothetical protein F511_25500 [Dorcoceras hygrometricum]